MAKSKSFFGLRRGSTKSHTYQVNNGQQITKDRVQSVRNPRTTAQTIQRMKINNARLFYNALNSAEARGVINHSFQGVAYNDPTRRAFMSLAMKKIGGPYVQKGVMNWIPGDYQVSKGSLAGLSAVISNVAPTPSGTQTMTTIQSGDTLTAQNVADLNALGVPSGAQVSMVVVSRNAGVFEALAFEFINQVGEIILDSDYGFMLYILKNSTTSAIEGASLSVGPYAGCCIISMQDQGGTWLRSTEKFWISDEVRAEFYSPAAFAAALQSYQDDTNANALNNPYFLNQAGASRAYDGSVVAYTVEDGANTYTFLAGLIIADGRTYNQWITSDGTNAGYLIGIDGNTLSITAEQLGGSETVTGLDGFQVPPTRLGYPDFVQYDEAMLVQGGF